MTIRTNTGVLWKADWIVGPTRTLGHVVAQLRDSRPLSVIAAEAEGATKIAATDRPGIETTYAVAGLAGLTREGDTVTLRMLPGGGGDE